MKTLQQSALFLAVPLIIVVLATVCLFLYALIFGGSWDLFLVAAGLSLGLVITAKVLALSFLDRERQFLVAGMLSELVGGVFGWIWMILAVASPVLLLKALFFHGTWEDFFICLFSAAVCKTILRYTMANLKTITAKQKLAEQGLTG